MFIVSSQGEEDIQVEATSYIVDNDGELVFFGPRKREVGRVKRDSWDTVFLAVVDYETEIEVVEESED